MMYNMPNKIVTKVIPPACVAASATHITTNNQGCLPISVKNHPNSIASIEAGPVNNIP